MTRAPSPRMRKAATGEESKLPPGFTLERYVRKNGEPKTGWRCGHIIQDPVHGDWRRCTKHCAKRDCLKHQRMGKHIFTLARVDDPGFPVDFDQRLERVTLQRGIAQLQQSIAQFAARANISARQGGGEVLDEFVHDVARISVRLARSSPDFQPESIPRISATTLTRRIREQGHEAFHRSIDEISGRIHYMNLLTDSGTVLDFSSLHAVLTNPNYPEILLPLDTFENRNNRSEDYEAVFRSLVTEVSGYNIELVAVVCDNCPAQVNGVAQALAFFPTLAILHIPCLNHMVNLAFTHALLDPIMTTRVTLLNEFISDLRSSEGLEIMGRKCPTMVKTRWIYTSDVLTFILRYRDDVNSVRSAVFHSPLPKTFKRLHWVLLPLKLFSLAVEAKDRKLHEVIPLSREVLRQFQIVRSLLMDDEDLHILDVVTAHFIARLRVNEFDAILTAWVLSVEGREWLRAEEKNFLTRFNYPGDPGRHKSDCVKRMETQFAELLRPWKNGEMDTEDASPQRGVVLEEIQLPHRSITDATIVHSDDPPGPLTRVGQQRADFSKALEQQYAATVNERLSTRLDVGAFHTAQRQVREMASALGMEADNVANQLGEWLFTLEIPDAPTIPDLHWRDVHARHPKWRDLARIGIRYASIATSEAAVERILGEQQEVQGLHGVNYGTETLHARLVLRHAVHP
jgi:hypothetical protein